ncbi:BTB/POZ domain-containing protein At5g48130 isoform X2 [Asparagus officinalis]|uniref:BTB/POZ domain-containing protein At5g48130 isoform X2 n=1 Tax=Asparagus officinalis TaxID=4686 RepID=UPI00098E416F|nr:BTB/POZ domain-containing protein At5g48130 isoform X2 [Asparagus officinalis]
MDSASTKAISPFASPNTGALLKKKIIAWSLETGLPASIHVSVGGKIFSLHKLPLVSKSGYFKRKLVDLSSVELPENFPGGSETFEMVALFCYNSSFPFDPFNIGALRCASKILEMTGDFSLCERTDLYINQVVLQSWDDTLIVLQKCQTLLPWAEELLIVSRCVESLAFMACMEILDPEHKKDWPVTSLQALTGHNWSSELVKEMAGRDLWIKDLIALPFVFFQRIISSLRRQGMKEKYVSPLVVFYANKWVLSEKTHKFWENSDLKDEYNDVNSRISEILQGILELLPMGEKGSRVIPASFYFSLLSRSMSLKKSVDFITSTPEFEAMKKIVMINMAAKNEEGYVVAELWDRYLCQIAMDPKLEPARFMELIEIIPMADRETHDHLYKALDTYLMEHPQLSSEEKTSVCKYLNCQKLSQDICIEAVQNEQMPLRLIVQALFVQQLHTHQAFKECSDSFRYIHCGEFSGSLSSSRCQIPRSQNLEESPFERATNIGPPLGSFLQKDSSTKRSDFSKEDYESTSFRLQALEQELVSIKQSLMKNVPKGTDSMSFRVIGLEGKTVVKKRKSLRHVNSCISLSWASQRKYASRILKILRKINMLGNGKSKIKKAASGVSSTSLACEGKPLQQMYNS